MISISTEQLVRLDQARMSQAIDHLVSRLQAQYPGSPPATEMRREILPLAQHLQDWGIRSASFLALHVLASRVFGLGYHERPVLRSVFSDPGISDELKEAWLGGWLSAVRAADTLRV